MSVFPNSFSSKVLKEQFVAAFIMVYFQVYSGIYGILWYNNNRKKPTISYSFYLQLQLYDFLTFPIPSVW